MRRAQEGSNPDLNEQFTELSELRVLVVEDDEDDFMLLSFLLGEATEDSVEVEWVKNYAEALEATTDRRHDIYLTDLRLGARTGLDLMKAWRDRGDLTPVVVLTGYSARANQLDAFEAGARYCLDKARLEARTLERAIRYSLSHQRLEVATREREAWYRSLVDVLDASGVGAVIHDASGKAVWISRTVEHLFGIDAESSAGCGSVELLRGIIAPCFEASEDFARRAIASLGDTERVERSEYQTRPDRDGEVRWIEHRSRPVGEGPHAGGRVEIYTDVTARRAAQSGVAEKEARLRALSIHAEHTFAILQPDRIFSFLSDSIEQLLGYPPDELVGTDSFALIHEEDQEPVGQVFAAALANPGEVYRVSFRYRHHDGRWRWLEAKVENRLDDEAVQGVVVNTQDVTEARAVAERARYSQALAAVDRVADKVARELSTSLATIAGQVQLLRDESAPGQRGNELLAGIEESIGRGGELIRQLRLAFGRRSPGGPEIFVLDQAMGEISWLLERVMRDDLHLQLELASHEEWVALDQRALELALLNLVVLLQGGMARGTTLRVHTGLGGDGLSGEPWIELRGPCAEFVEDDAVTGDPSCAWRGRVLSLKGIGEMLEAEGATLEAEQSQAGNLRVRIGLPRPPSTEAEVIESLSGLSTTEARVAEPTNPQAPPAPIEVPEEPTVVLVVEDDAQLQHITQRLLAGQGYLPLGTGTFTDAVELAEEYEGPIHVVLSDVGLPDGDGRRLVERLKQSRPELEVILMSGEALDETGDKDEPIVLAKPFPPTVLFETLRKLLGGAEER